MKKVIILEFIIILLVLMGCKNSKNQQLKIISDKDLFKFSGYINFSDTSNLTEKLNTPINLYFITNKEITDFKLDDVTYSGGTDIELNYINLQKIRSSNEDNFFYIASFEVKVKKVNYKTTINITELNVTIDNINHKAEVDYLIDVYFDNYEYLYPIDIPTYSVSNLNDTINVPVNFTSKQELLNILSIDYSNRFLNISRNDLEYKDYNKLNIMISPNNPSNLFVKTKINSECGYGDFIDYLYIKYKLVGTNEELIKPIGIVIIYSDNENTFERYLSKN